MSEAVTLRKVYDELRALKDVVARREDVEALLDTDAILQNAETMRELRSSRADVRAGRVRVIQRVSDLFG